MRFPALRDGYTYCTCFEFWLVHWIVCVLCDWPERSLSLLCFFFVFVSRHSMNAKRAKSKYQITRTQKACSAGNRAKVGKVSVLANAFRERAIVRHSGLFVWVMTSLTYLIFAPTSYPGSLSVSFVVSRRQGRKRRESLGTRLYLHVISWNNFQLDAGSFALTMH